MHLRRRPDGQREPVFNWYGRRRKRRKLQFPLPRHTTLVPHGKMPPQVKFSQYKNAKVPQHCYFQIFIIYPPKNLEKTAHLAPCAKILSFGFLLKKKKKRCFVVPSTSFSTFVLSELISGTASWSLLK